MVGASICQEHRHYGNYVVKDVSLGKHWNINSEVEFGRA